MKDIFIKDNFLTDNECNELIELYNKTEKNNNSDGVWTGRGRWPVYTDKQIEKLVIKRKELVEKYFNKKFEIDNLHIMIWDVGHKMTPHSDYGSKNEFPHREYASIIYLNDDYEGGDLVIPKIKFVNKPKKGQLITFAGGKLIHGVTKITKGKRYTSICWFTEL